MRKYAETEYTTKVCLNCNLEKCSPNSKSDCLVAGMRGDRMKHVFDLIQKYKVVENSGVEKIPVETIEALEFLAKAELIKKTEIGFAAL